MTLIDRLADELVIVLKKYSNSIPLKTRIKPPGVPVTPKQAVFWFLNKVKKDKVLKQKLTQAFEEVISTNESAPMAAEKKFELTSSHLEASTEAVKIHARNQLRAEMRKKVGLE